jgi:hypothetical protein
MYKYLISAGFFLISLGFSQDVWVTDGSWTTLKSNLISKDNGTIYVKGTYTINEKLTLSGKKSLSIVGKGAKFNFSPLSSLTFTNDSNLVVSNIDIYDNSVSQGEHPFDFIACSKSGLENIRYTAVNPLKRFVMIRKGSNQCFVRNCYIKNSMMAIWVGDNGDGSSVNIEPDGNPTSNCLIENNVIDGFSSHGIVTRSRYNVYLLSDPNSRLKHVISGNTIKRPNITGGYPQSVSIEVWGSEVSVKGNVLSANPLQPSFIGISFAKAYRPICSNNRVSGAFTYQGIELATVNEGIVSDNHIDSVSNAADPNSAGIGVSTSQTTEPTSLNNIIKNNVISNCRNALLIAGGYSDQTLVEGNVLKQSTQFAIESSGGFFIARGNTFVDNSIAIHRFGGSLSERPTRISENEFINTTNQVLYNENQSAGRPFIFQNNLVNGWGSDTYPEAIVLRCGSSKIIGNTFIKDSRTNQNPNVPICAATKSFGYGSVRHLFKDNVMEGAPLSISNIVGDKVGLNLINYQNWYSNPDDLTGNWP